MSSHPKIKFAAAALLAFILPSLALPAFSGESPGKWTGKLVSIRLAGRKEPVKGKCLQDDNTGITLLSRSIHQLIPREKIQGEIEPWDPKKEFEEEFEKGKIADDLVELARRCDYKEVSLPELKAKCLKKAIEIDGNHREARKMRGEVRYSGKQEKFQGQWIEQKKYKEITGESYIAGREKVEAEFEGVDWCKAFRYENKGKNLTFTCNSKKEVADRYWNLLNALYPKYKEVLGKKDPRLDATKGTVYVVRSRAEFNDFTLQDVGTGGYYSELDRSVRTFHGFFGVEGTTEQILAHEMTHMFQHKIWPNLNRVPIWLVEGMAVYFGEGTEIDSRTSPAEVKLNKIPRQRLGSLKLAINLGEPRYLSLEKLLTLRGGDPLIRQYDHGWGVIFWCLQGENKRYKFSSFGKKGAGEKIWSSYLEHLSKEVRSLREEADLFKDLLTKNTGKSIEEWEKNYKDFIKNLPLQPLGKWSPGEMAWDGSILAGIRLRFPKGWTPVVEEDLRLHFDEAAAAVSPEGARIWLSVLGFGEDAQDPSDALGEFVDRRFQDIEDRIDERSGDLITVSFSGKFNEMNEKIFSKSGKSPAANRFKLVLFSTENKFYLISIGAGEEEYKANLPEFEKVVGSVELNLKL